MTRAITMTLLGAALTLSACGGDDQGGSADKPAAQQKPQRSALDCLDLSVLSPERHSAAAPLEDRAVEPLVTDGAQASTILGGDELGGVVIEYPRETAASSAYGQARASKKLDFLSKSQVILRNKVLFLDYSEDEHARRIVQGCAQRPNQPPPTP